MSVGPRVLGTLHSQGWDIVKSMWDEKLSQKFPILDRGKRVYLGNGSAETQGVQLGSSSCSSSFLLATHFTF